MAFYRHADLSIVS